MEAPAPVISEDSGDTWGVLLYWGVGGGATPSPHLGGRLLGSSILWWRLVCCLTPLVLCLDLLRVLLLVPVTEHPVPLPEAECFRLLEEDRGGGCFGSISTIITNILAPIIVNAHSSSSTELKKTTGSTTLKISCL